MNANHILYLVLVALVIWLILKFVGVAISSTLFWVVLIVLLVAALFSGGRRFW